MPSPTSSFSPSRPSIRCFTPVAITTVLPSKALPSSVVTTLTSPWSSTATARSNSISAPWARIWSSILSANSLPLICSVPG